MRIDIQDISWSILNKQILKGINLTIPSGSFVGLIGPNGSGKTSLLRIIYRYISPNTGNIKISGEDLFSMRLKDVAKIIAVVAQEKPTDFQFTVEEIVMMGRIPHKKLFEADSIKDREIVNESLERVGMQEFHQRNFNSLSGGEKQRVLIARALAQQPKILILDEPTNHLDIRYQLEVLDLVKSIRKTTIVVLHDLNLAAKYCDYLYLLHAGKVVKEGEAIDVLTSENLGVVYGVVADIINNKNYGQLDIIFRGLQDSFYPCT